MFRYVLVTLLTAAGCGTSARSGGQPFKAPADLAFNFGGDLAMVENPIDPPPGPDDPCNERAKLVFVVDENDTLSSFKPDTLKFQDIGTLKCPAMGGATPFSMAVDRNATAWVLYNSGELFKVDTTNAKCTATKFVVGQQGFTTFGMGFATNALNTNDETLYVSASDGGIGLGDEALGKIDLVSMKVTRIGALNGSPELTGTGDAKLWGFFPDDVMPRVAQLDKASGKEMKTYPLNNLAGSPNAWAFAFWGGDFWIFLKRISDNSTKVYRLRPMNGSVSTPIPDTGRTIVGAGVSTCAPLTPIG